MFGGLIGYAVGHITGGIARWMYVFIIFGALSIAWGIVSLLFLPDMPSTAKFLTEEERIVAVERVAANRQGIKNSQFKVDQMWQTFRDPKTWLLFILAVGAQVPNSALTSVSAGEIMQSFIKSLTLTLLVYIHHCRIFWLRHLRHTISPDPRRCCPVPRPDRRWLRLHEMAKH